MKPFMGIDLTADKKNEQPNGAQLLVATPSPALAQALERSTASADATVSRAQLPTALRVIQYVCGILGMLAVVGILRGLGNVTIAQAYRNASWVFWIGGACLLVWAVLKLMSMAKSKAVLDTEESTHILTNLERTCSAVYTELAVPAHAKEVDILSFFYKVKDGQIKPCEKGMQVTPYIAPVFKVFADAQQLYLVNLEGKYAIPLDSIRAIQTVKKHIRVSGWNKEEACNQGFYKQFKLTTDQYGCVHSKQYYILEFTHGGETWGVYFPCYELPFFEAVTGRKAQ